MVAITKDGRFCLPESTEEVARFGNAFAEIGMAKCEDGLYRSSYGYHYSYGGLGSPIFLSTPGYHTESDARDAALSGLIARLKGAEGNGDPEHAQHEMRQLLKLTMERFTQPSLF